MITNRLVALIRVKPLHKSLLSMVNQQRFLASPTKVLLLEDKQRNKEADTVEKRQMEIEEERLKREIKTAQQSTQSVLVKSLPSQLTPYIELMRLDKPKPVLLVYWPSIWGILGATSYLNLHTPDFYLMGLFFVGAMFTRASGCIMNDLWDRRLDKKVERTQTRPLASGRVGVPAALALLAGNLSISLACLIQLNLPTQILGACALFPIAMYPTAKRFTNWPQLILGTTFGWGSLMGWSAVIFSQGAAASSLAHMNILEFLPALFAYAGSVAWITMYDTIYGFQDIKFDRENGIRSASIHLEKRLKSSLFGLSALSLANLAIFGAFTHQEPIYYISLGAVALHFVKQILFLDPKSPKSALKQFNSNNTVGALVTFGLLASILIK